MSLYAYIRGFQTLFIWGFLMWIKRAVQFLLPFSRSHFCLTTLLTTTLHMLQGQETFRKFCIIESHPRPYTSFSSSTLFFPRCGYRQHAPHECRCQPTALRGLITYWDDLNNPHHGNLKMYDDDWPYIDVVIAAYPSARKLDPNTKQNTFHTPTPSSPQNTCSTPATWQQGR